MLTVVVDARGQGERLAGALAALTPAAVDGLVREVIVVAMREFDVAAALCEEMGALIDYDLWVSFARAKSDWLLVLPAGARFAEGWVERLGDHLAAGPRPALLRGLKAGGLFSKRPFGVLIAREAVRGLAHPNLDRLRRALGGDAARLA